MPVQTARDERDAAPKEGPEHASLSHCASTRRLPASDRRRPLLHPGRAAAMPSLLTSMQLGTPRVGAAAASARCSYRVDAALGRERCIRAKGSRAALCGEGPWLALVVDGCRCDPVARQTLARVSPWAPE